MTPIRVVTAAQAAARDSAAISGGTPSRALMQRAGAAAAGEICRRLGSRLSRGVAVFAGPGNNGGDAWVVARALGTVGVRVRVHEVGTAKSDDARSERALAVQGIEAGEPTGAEEVVIDGLLGTGASGVPRGAMGSAIERIAELRARGAVVVALDVPSGLDATSGQSEGAVEADLTITFGTVKRGLLVARANAGRIALVDIGLGYHAEQDDGAPELVDARWVGARLPRIAANAHKGVRRRLAIVGGGEGMLGAALLSARAAMSSGVGMVRVLVAPMNVAGAQTALYEAMAKPWPDDEREIELSLSSWAHGVLLGPGLGRSEQTRDLVERVLRAWRGPVVLDADALNVFEGDTDRFATLLRGRQALITPHVSEMGRLVGASPDEVLSQRFEAGESLARQLGACVLLKGVPTVITSPDGRRVVTAAGTPVLAAAGSGDLLAGIAGTLVTQMDDAFTGGACAAWIHGRAGELANEGLEVRGVELSAILAALPRAWDVRERSPRYPVLLDLPSPGEHKARAERTR